MQAEPTVAYYWYQQVKTPFGQQRVQHTSATLSQVHSINDRKRSLVSTATITDDCYSDFAQSTGNKERASAEQKHGLARMAKCLDIKITCNYPGVSLSPADRTAGLAPVCLSAGRRGSLLTDRSTVSISH